MIPLLIGLLSALLSAPQTPAGGQKPPPVPAPAPAPAPAPSGAPAQTPAPLSSTSGSAQSAEKVAWSAKELTAALKDAKADSKLVMVYFRQDNDPESDLVSKEVLGNEDVAASLKDVICLKVDVKKQAAIASQYNVTFTPIFAWFNPDGTPRDRFGSFKELRFFQAAINRIKADAGTINELRKKVAADGNDLESRYELYRRLKEFGDIQGSSEQKAAILKIDKDGTSRGAHHFAYDRITSDIERYWQSNAKLPDAKIAELQTFVEMENVPEIIWDGWMRLANTYAYYATQSAATGKFADAAAHRVTRRACLAKAWRGLPGEPDYLKDWCETNGKLFWDERDELTPADKEFMMTMSQRYMDAFPNDAAPCDLRARACFLNGKRVQAIEASEEAVKRDPNNKEFQERLKLFRGS
jgi:hypothetical protein